MRKIEPMNDIKKTVDLLQTYKKYGISVYCDFNGHTLYSETVTLDSAYLEITGMTYAEYEEAVAAEIARWRKQTEERKAQARAKKPEWIERGRKLIPQELWSEWERCIDIRIEDLYDAREIEASLRVMEAHFEGTPISEISEMIDAEGHSGASYGVFRSIILTFYVGGEQLMKELQEYKTTPKNSGGTIKL